MSERVDPLIGEMLGKDYRVLEPIGFGGMAVVYLVEHQTLLKRFAAKVLSPELAANFEARARFTQEAHAASQLDHENIVLITDFGVTTDQRPFFVMELLRGQTLDQRVAEGPMTIEEVVAVAVPVARALAHAHAEGIVHRDVKPENVFLVQRSQGRWGVKVVDFGIAKTPINVRLTKMGQTLGSPMFMAPEACRGEDVDHRADIYSFGILLYLMLCGRVPFHDESLLKVLQMQVTSPLPPPRVVNPSLSPELAQVLERALAKDPDARYISMGAVLAELEAALPPGSDRLLIEAQHGTSLRSTPFPGSLTLARSGESQRLARISEPPVSAPVIPIAPTRRRGLYTIAIVSVLFAAFGVAFAWQRMTTTAEAPPEHAADVREPRPGNPAVAANGSAATVAAGSGSAAAPPPVNVAAPAMVHLHVGSRPPGAEVLLDNRRLGITPLDLEVERTEESAKLIVNHDGFEPLTRSIELHDAVALDLDLHPIKHGHPPTTPPVRPPPHHPGDGSAASPNSTGSGSAAKGDPSLDIRLSR